ncbi:uncharacterized protein METZ01_LOCUS234765 [marine metagenome]|uniref:Uncharacterized protein n=1 Tax=marine metagenome TaxID=408172 RepID=A0A382H661_9ZZZZ
MVNHLASSLLTLMQGNRINDQLKCYKLRSLANEDSSGCTTPMFHPVTR